jgi:scyllo-inositol 2-dehydrogenase (NADP+)
MNVMKKKINTGIIGFGLSGRVFHAPFLHLDPGFKITKIVERNSEDSKTFYPEAEVVKDYSALLNDPLIELIVICTPNHLHFQMAKDSLLAGKHVVIDKPFTVSVKEANELIGLSLKINRKIFVYHNRRWDGDFLTIRKLLKSGALGELSEFEAHFDRFRPHITDHNWREEAKNGGGVLYDLGSHLIDQALQLFGTPHELEAEIASQRKGSKVDDFFRIILYYKNLRAILTAGMLVKAPGPRYIIHGLLGSFIKYGIDPQENDLREGLLPDTDDWGTESPEHWGLVTIDYLDLNVHGSIETEAGCYQEFYRNVYDVLINDSDIAVKTIEARNVIRIIELAFESSRKNQKMKVKL